MYTSKVREVKAQHRRGQQRAEATRRRVVDAAERLFLSGGYHTTTIEAIAAAADVSVETIYKRFGNKAALLRATVALAVVEAPDPTAFIEQFLALPPLQAVRAETDQAAQLRLLAGFSRTRLQRSADLHRMLRQAGSGDPVLAEFISADHAIRRQSQRALIDLLMVNGPLRRPPDEAAETYSALANPDLYLLLTTEHRWTPERFETWLGDSFIALLLDGKSVANTSAEPPTGC